MRSALSFAYVYKVILFAAPMRILPSGLSATETVGSGVGEGVGATVGAGVAAPPQATVSTRALTKTDATRMWSLRGGCRGTYAGRANADEKNCGGFLLGAW